MWDMGSDSISDAEEKKESTLEQHKKKDMATVKESTMKSD